MNSKVVISDFTLDNLAIILQGSTNTVVPTEQVHESVEARTFPSGILRIMA